jgi:hypothetical protein
MRELANGRKLFSCAGMLSELIKIPINSQSQGLLSKGHRINDFVFSEARVVLDRLELA